MSNPVIDDALDKIYPVVNGAGSDSAMLDNTLEFLVMSGMDLPLAVMVTIPEPWTKDGSISRAKRDLYQYYAIMMEPWDGPASILFSDGDAMGAVLDRNGLRPSRYYITDDGKLILSSEVGALDLDPRKIVKKSRLEPGKMLLVDTVQGRPPALRRVAGPGPHPAEGPAGPQQKGARLLPGGADPAGEGLRLYL